ncbi:MAG TPA: RagB/SusD family nutrient uptake outer membrane protein, partial [Flavisolibacter sp.]|nr:RagB/SusD family nutrient uptake outer membrane protein [Flavisolibacter sp.]
MFKIKKAIYALLIVSIAATSCKKLLDQEPASSLDATTAFTNRQAVEAGVLGIYSALQSGNYYGLRYWALADLYADVLTHTGTFPSFAQYFNRQLLPDNTENTAMWSAIYDGINRANNIIAAVPNINDPAFNKEAALGEARFLRALMYFDLVRAWGGSVNGYNQSGGTGVPIFTDPTLTPEGAAPKAKSAEADVYQLINDDLDYAMVNLPAARRTGRANIDVATALKARFELYRGNWEQAEVLATTVIDKFKSTTAFGGLVPGENYASLWTTQNLQQESLFELQFDQTDANSIAFFYYPTALGGRNEISSTTTLAAAHEPGDIRLPVNVSVATTTTPVIPANKTLKYSEVAGTDNFIIIRLAELYLIRAEARAKQSKLTEALEDVNLIRRRAGLA